MSIGLEKEKMDKEQYSKKNSFSGLKFKILISLFFSNLIIFSFTLMIIFLFGSGLKNIINYFIIISVPLVFMEYIMYYYIRKIQKKSFMVGILFQNYIEKSQSTINEFIYPKKNIANSFGKQFEFTSQTTNTINQIFQMISKTIQEINDCKTITISAENRLKEAASIMEKLGQSIEVIKSATGDMDKMLQIINQITLKSIVITDIVAKTELLAMNASIEAARAGDHGKGFSVVSEEVETLARTSGKSAKQIKDLLNESSIKVNQIIRTMNERIKEGEIVSKKALDAFQRISEGVDGLKEQIQIISEGTDMQKGHIKNVEDTILKVLNDTNQNQSLIESGNILIDKLIEINEKLIESSVDSQKAFSGQDGVTFMEKNKGNEVRRALKSMGF